MTSDSSSQRLDVAVVVGHAIDARSSIPPALEAAARRVVATPDLGGALQALEDHQPQLVILRESIAVTDALGFIGRAKAVSSQSVVVVVAQCPCVEHAVRLIGAGACDYVPGPLDDQCFSEMLVKLKTELAHASQASQRFFCDHCPPDVSIVGQSDAIRRTLETIRMVAQSRCNPVLILGETGTGKELAARAVHSWRSGSQARFVDVNCAALTANLLESELFGHAKGSFTGADRDKIGLFELAGTGTIFLDEISEMPLELQAKLLRVLQERTFRKVGGTQDLVCQATVIASSNRNLLAEVAAGRFRKDLYYRLAIFPVTLPSLRDRSRRGDVPLLAEFFLHNSEIAASGKICGLDRSAREKLLSHHWPGNVRELRNVIDRAMILERGRRISAASILIEDDCTCPGGSADASSASRQPPPADTLTDPKAFSLETAEREFILRALKETGWQRTRAAALLGITRATLHTKLKRYDIQPPGAKPAETPDTAPKRPIAAAAAS
jgi:two-component system response regulator AtoC